MRMVDVDIQPGQRWVSDAEPELGLGVVMSAGSGRVSILFPAADDRREYALDSAPVRRVAFDYFSKLPLRTWAEQKVYGPLSYLNFRSLISFTFLFFPLLLSLTIRALLILARK